MKYIIPYNESNIKHIMEILNNYDISIEDIFNYNKMTKLFDINPEIFKIYKDLKFYNKDFINKHNDNIERLKNDNNYKYLFDTDDLGLL